MSLDHVTRRLDQILTFFLATLGFCYLTCYACFKLPLPQGVQILIYVLLMGYYFAPTFYGSMDELETRVPTRRNYLILGPIYATMTFHCVPLFQGISRGIVTLWGRYL
jgi:hypothetical protein